MQPGADGMADHHREKREIVRRGGEEGTNREGERDRHLPLAVFSVRGGRSGL